MRQNRKQSRSFFIKKQNQISFVHHFPLPFHLVYKLVHLSHLSSWVQKQYKIITRYNNNTKKVVNMYSCFFKEYYFHDLHLQLHFIKSGEQYEEKKSFALVSSPSINSIYIEGENQAGKNLPVLPQPTLSHSLSFLSPHLPPLSPSTPQQRRKKSSDWFRASLKKFRHFFSLSAYPVLRYFSNYIRGISNSPVPNAFHRRTPFVTTLHSDLPASSVALSLMLLGVGGAVYGAGIFRYESPAIWALPVCGEMWRRMGASNGMRNYM